MRKPPARKVFKASPTKEFFTHMFVRDIHLNRAILDLVDNCVDGALRLRRTRTFDGLWVALEARPDRFRISDNCGGIPMGLAREYAFRFGRARDADVLKHSVGRFGVGLKRALFKLGGKFVVESWAKDGSFAIDVDVEEWEEDELWEFEFSDARAADRPTGLHTGTVITATDLHPSVSSDLSSDRFLSDLRRELELAHEIAIAKRLAVSLNGKRLSHTPPDILQSKTIVPGVSLLKEDGVAVKLIAGIGPTDPSNAGWRVYCNSRMVLRADQSSDTGWGDGIPRYHNQYARFRGYAFFDSDDPDRMPWTTTKSGVDTDSPVYRPVRAQMIRMMRPVITFLNALDREKDHDNDYLERAVESAQTTELVNVTHESKFAAPSPPPRPPSSTTHISYSRPRKQVETAKKQLGVRTNGAVGEKTFDYFLIRECK